MKTGSPWRDLSIEFGPWQTVYKRFSRWAKSGLLDELLLKLSKDADPEAIMIDSTCSKLHQHGTGRGYHNQGAGRTRGGLNTKIHSVVDALGNSPRIYLTPGNLHDMVPACKLMSGLSAKYVLDDKAYDADDLIELIKVSDSEVVIPPKSNRLEQGEYDRHIYKERHLVECFFAKIKSFRRVATRYEKMAVTFRAFVLIASCLVWLQ